MVMRMAVAFHNDNSNSNNSNDNNDGIVSIVVGGYNSLDSIK